MMEIKTTKEYYCEFCKKNYNTTSHALLNGSPHTCYKEIIITWVRVDDDYLKTVSQLKDFINSMKNFRLEDGLLPFNTADYQVMDILLEKLDEFSQSNPKTIVESGFTNRSSEGENPSSSKGSDTVSNPDVKSRPKNVETHSEQEISIPLVSKSGRDTFCSCGHRVFCVDGVWMHDDRVKLHPFPRDNSEKEYLGLNDIPERELCECEEPKPQRDTLIHFDNHDNGYTLKTMCGLNWYHVSSTNHDWSLVTCPECLRYKKVKWGV